VTDQERIKARLQKQKRVILALDGLQPDVGHEVLWVVRDCLSEEILLARPLLSSTQGDITALLQEAKRLLETLEVPVKGALSDGEETIRSAVAFVFPEVLISSISFIISKMPSSLSTKLMGMPKPF
jgi:hypothetical protein